MVDEEINAPSVEPLPPPLPSLPLVLSAFSLGFCEAILARATAAQRAHWLAPDERTVGPLLLLLLVVVVVVVVDDDDDVDDVDDDDDVDDVDDVDDGGVAAATNTRAWIVTGVRAKAVRMHGGMPCSFPSGVGALALTSPFETVSVFLSPGVF